MTGGKFEPKTPVVLAPPKDDPITLEKLATANGIPSPTSLLSSSQQIIPTGVDSELTYVAIKGKVYDVTGNKAYQPGGSYHGIYTLSLCCHTLGRELKERQVIG
jgi:membrane-associated progesterone receptor component